MDTAFLLQGDLTVKTDNFERGLKQSELRLKQCEKAITATESKARSFGDTSATTARKFEKLHLAIQEGGKKLALLESQYKKGEITAKQYAKGLEQIDRSVKRVSSSVMDAQAKMAGFNSGTSESVSRLTQLDNKLQSIGGQLQNVGGGMMRVGAAFTAGLTVPLSGAAYALFQVGSNASSLKNQLYAATGTMDGANKKLAELRDLARDNVGVLSNNAVAMYGFLKPLSLADGSINKMIVAIGKLKLANDSLDIQNFTRNMEQLWSGGFNATDFKEMVRAMPRAGEIMKKAFSLEGNDIAESMRKAIASGKITKDQFYGLFADAVNNDEVYSKLSDTVSTKLAKAFARIRIAFEPFAETFTNIVENIVNYIEPIITKIGQSFSGLSKPIQTVIITIGALAAALGPIIVAVAGVVMSFGALVASAKIIGIVGLALVGLTVQLAPLIAMAGALALAWKTNFANIQGYVTQAMTAIQNAFNVALSHISNLTNSVLSQINQFWSEHGEEIKSTVEAVSNWVQNKVNNFLSAVQAFWKEHGERITAIVVSTWNFIQAQITTALNLIGGIIRTVMAVIRGDWSTAWEGVKAILTNAIAFLVRAFNQFQQMIWQTFLLILNRVKTFVANFAKTLVDGFRNAVNWAYNVLSDLPNIIRNLIPSLLSAGASLGSAIWNGIKNGLASGAASAAGGINNLSINNGDLTASSSFKFGGASAPRVGGGGGGRARRGGGGSGGGGGVSETVTALNELKDAYARLDASAQKYMKASFPELPKSITKNTLAYYQELTKVANEIANVGAETEEARFKLELATAKYKHLTDAQKQQLLAMKAFPKTIADAAKGAEKLQAIFDGLVIKDDSALGKLNELKLDPDFIAHYETLGKTFEELQQEITAAQNALNQFNANKAGNEYVASMQKSLEIGKKATEVTKIEWEIKNGYLKNASEAIQNQARYTAELIDAESLLTEAKRLSNAEDEKRKQLIEAGKSQYDSFYESLRSQLSGSLTLQQQLEQLYQSEAGKAYFANAGAEAAKLKADLEAMVYQLDVLNYKAGSWSESFSANLAKMQSEISSFGQAIGTGLTNAIEGIGGVFTSAINEWDGTLKGFFSSVGRGFANLIQQMIQELIKLAMIKLALNIASSFMGGVGVGKNGLANGKLAFATPSPLASGGYVTGKGTSTSDDIPAWLSDGEYVLKASAVDAIGVSNLDRWNNAKKFASGGLVGGSSGASSPVSATTTTNNTPVVINIHAPNVRDVGGFKASVSQQMNQAARALQGKLIESEGNN